MNIKALKYLLVFSVPALFAVGAFAGGVMTWSALIFAFGIVPLSELVFAPNPRNIQAAEREMRRKDRIYDVMLWSVLPVVYASAVLYMIALRDFGYHTWEVAGLTVSLAVVLGGLGINVAHELGHRPSKTEQAIGKLLLLPSGYMHFFTEHNFGHHKNVGTHADPATSRKNESLYAFWVRSVTASYLSAWRIQKNMLKRAGKSFWSTRNDMLIFTAAQAAWWITIIAVFGWRIGIAYTFAAVGGFLLLETVNYIEHYGLTRKKESENRYERVRPVHSWNSNHAVGRLMLFELSRHSDHHYQPAKKYQLLDHHPESPQMPTGYPGMMLLSAIPPLWFAVMNPRIPGEASDKSRSISAAA